ncbi:MAG: hypothetical protein ACOWYE_07590 [Desulfatiglandales bacterium]
MTSLTDRRQPPFFAGMSTGLWEFIFLSEYSVPTLPARGTLQKKWLSLKRMFRPGNDENPPFKHDDELCTLDEARLAHLLAPVNWDAVVTALDSALQDWVQDKGAKATVRFVIGQPHSGLAETVRRWATRCEAMVIAPPGHQELLGGDSHWLDRLSDAGGLWVLPNLEHCYLRHASGLSLMRRFLEEAESGRLGLGVIACDSWAWAYLQRIWPVVHAEALTLQSFDGLRLAHLLAYLTVAGSSEAVCYRNARTGKAILTVPSGVDEAGPEVVQLAALCRGNFAIAVHYWLARLRAEPEVDESQTDERTAKGEKPEESERVVWVTPEWPHPLMPMEREDDSVLILHCLLLHGGLPETLLPELLPLSHTECMAILTRLHNAGVVERRKDRWMVPELAYSSVRELLGGYGYLIDQF